MALPYLNLFIGDIMRDTDVLSPKAFGGYLRLLFKMHAASPRGEVSFTTRQLCRVFGAATIQETIVLLNEITDPAHNICDYVKKGDKHFFVNRRMRKESGKSEARSYAGKLGAQKTNAKNRQNEKIAASFAAAGDASDDASFAASSAVAKNRQKHGSGNGIGNNVNNKLKANSEKTAGPGIEIVPEMLLIWKRYKPAYLVQRKKDYPALQKIAELITEQEKLNISIEDGCWQLLLIWTAIVEFIASDNFLKDYQINQVERYFQNISSKFLSNKDTGSRNHQQSTIQNNAEAAQQARNMLNAKYADTTCVLTS